MTSRLHNVFRRGAVAAALAVALLAAEAQAEVGTLDVVPAATLLLPYFEVDLEDANGPQTRIALTNTGSVATLAHLTLHSDLGVPTFAVDLFLGGHDSIEVDLRLLFEGVLPRTGPDGSYPGPYSTERPVFDACPAPASARYAGFPAVRLSPAQRAHLRAAHTGLPTATFAGDCAGAPHGDAVARGFVTIDATRRCADAFPGEPGYFLVGGSGTATNANVLTGRFVEHERRTGSVVEAPLVHLDASTTSPVTDTPGDYTFYATRVDGTAADHREPAGVVWSVPRPAGAVEAELVVWREPLTHRPFDCDLSPPPGQLPGARQIIDFDADGAPDLGATPTVPVRAAQRVPMPADGGFRQLNLAAPHALTTALTVPNVPQSVVLLRYRRADGAAALEPVTLLAGPHQLLDSDTCDAVRFPLLCDSFRAVIP